MSVTFRANWLDAFESINELSDAILGCLHRAEVLRHNLDSTDTHPGALEQAIKLLEVTVVLVNDTLADV